MYRVAKGQKLGLKQYLLLAVCGLVIGVLTGLGVTVFVKGFAYVTSLRAKWFAQLVPFLSLVGLVIVYLYQVWGGQSVKGLQLVFELGQGKEKALPKRMPLLAVISTWLTHLFGGSAGRTGVAVQIGAVIGNLLAPYLSIPDRQRVLTVTGIAAGFAGLFQTPWTATIFACEALVLGQFQLFAILPAFLAAWSATVTTQLLGVTSFRYALPQLVEFDIVLIFKVMLLGMIFGLVGDAFAIVLTKLRLGLPRLLPNPYYRILCMGSLLSVGLYLAHLGRYSGTGATLIEGIFAGQSPYPYDWLLKLVLTILTMSIGFQGGEVTPLFAVGASLGACLAPLLDLPVFLSAALGYLAVFGSATNTFLVPFILGVEIFGWDNAGWFALCAFVATRFNRQLSIYPFQLILDN